MVSTISTSVKLGIIQDEENSTKAAALMKRWAQVGPTFQIAHCLDALSFEMIRICYFFILFML